MAGPITKVIPIEVFCIPENPLYLRWVNAHGMIDQWCFGVNQIYRTTTKDGERIRLNFTDYTDQKALTQILSRESVDEIDLQHYDLTLQQVIGLKGLLQSNMVEMLVDIDETGSTFTWQKVKVKPGTFDLYQTKLQVFNFECTIEKAETLIQTY